MYKEFVINYKVKTVPFPYWYTFTTYAETEEEAIKAFLAEYPINIEAYRITAVHNI